MTQAEIQITAKAMQAFGGSFVEKLGCALAAADDDNAAKLLAAFYEIIARRYGPGSTGYASIERRMLPQPEVTDSSFGEFQELSK